MMNWCNYEWECCMEGGRIMDTSNPWYWIDKDMVSIEDDVLTLQLMYKPKKIIYNDVQHFPIMACGTVRSVQDFGYGTFSADIKLPKGYGLWSSFWLSGEHNWPPEIDICESYCDDNSYFNWFTNYFPYLNPSWKTTNNIHYLNKGHKVSGSKNISIFKQFKDPSDVFVNYKVEWFPTMIRFYINNKLVRVVDNNIPRDLVNNLNYPDKGYNMDVIFNTWCKDPNYNVVCMTTSMQVKNFIYKPLLKI